MTDRSIPTKKPAWKVVLPWIALLLPILTGVLLGATNSMRITPRSPNYALIQVLIGLHFLFLLVCPAFLSIFLSLKLSKTVFVRIFLALLFFGVIATGQVVASIAGCSASGGTVDFR